MSAVPLVDAGRLARDDFAATTTPGDLLYFLVNVGDGDCQLIVLPEDRNGHRRAVVVDVANEHKLGKLLAMLTAARLLTSTAGRLPLVVATHPHDDHIRGMPAFLALHQDDIGEFWEPGFLGTTAAFHEMMCTLENIAVPRRRPTSGYVAVIDNVRVTVVAPSVRLRQQMLTHIVAENNASLALRIEFPAARVRQIGGHRQLEEALMTSSLLLGADAQFDSWAQAAVDFPRLRLDSSAHNRALRGLVGRDVLRAQVFKVPHHGSKHGVNVELAERVAAEISVVSCAVAGARYEFPHELARAALRDARGQNLTSGPTDDVLGIHYTGAFDTEHRPLGTICVRMKRNARQVWRFQDNPTGDVDLSAALRWL